MRFRIAMLLVVVFALAGIGATVAPPASASISWGYCSLNANKPVAQNGYAVSKVTIGCGVSSTVTYQECTQYMWYGDVMMEYCQNKSTPIIGGAPSKIVYGSQAYVIQTHGCHWYDLSGDGYRTHIIAYGQSTTSDQACLS
jgi:hypothetical protein